MGGQLAFVFEPPTQRREPNPMPAVEPPTRPPLPPLPAMPRNPTKAVRARVEAQRASILAVCRCPHCPNDFADGDAYWAHRDPRTGRCLAPAAVGLTLQPRPVPCWAREETA